MAAPKIRFKGFVDDWEKRKLWEVAEINPRSVLPASFEYVDLESVIGTSLIAHRTENKDTAPSMAQRLAKKGDVFYQTVRPYQKNNLLFNMDSDNFVFSTRYAQLRPHIDSYFLFCKLQEEKFVAEVLDNCTGTSYPAINSTDLSQIEVDIALVKSEQTSIGNFFRTLDETIALHKRKLDGLKELKKGYLQQMFPQVGESVPRVRFAGFSGEWEVKHFGDVAVKSGQRNNAGKDYPSYSVSNQAGFVPQNEQFEDSRLDVLDKSAYKIVQPNEFAYNPARVNVGSIAFNKLDFPVIVSSLYVVVKMMESVDNEFILQFIMSPRFISEVRKNTEGTVREYLFFENFSNILFPYASDKAEQIVIGNFFRNLDEQIAAQAQKVEQLKQLKAAYLQGMFV